MKMLLKNFSPLFIACFLSVPSFSQVRLSTIVADSMILQRDKPIKIWGWAGNNEKISVRFNGKTYKTRADAKGNWSVMLQPTNAGGPYTMDITASNKITLKDILMGDVWLASGQSNMEYQLGYDDATYGEEMAAVNFPEIRQFKVPIHPAMDSPKAEMSGGSWRWANPKDIRPFSAVAYFFAKNLYQKYHVPIGIINSSVGGTPIEAWTSEEGLQNFPGIISTVEKNKQLAASGTPGRPGGFGGRQQQQTNDKGMNAPIPWYDPNYQPVAWKTITVPAYWEDQGLGDLNGVVWYRKEVDVPASMTGKPARVYLGRMVDADVLYINGKQVGRTFSLYTERRYDVPADLLKPGKNLFVSRVTNNNGKGGFVPDKPYYLFAGKDTVSLVGYWKYKVGEVFPPREPGGGGGSGFVSLQNSPTALYNGMIAPVTNYTIKGFLWYQGESNVSRAAQYADLQKAEINDWRKQWNLGELPFLFVQMPNYQEYNYTPMESNWALIRESQAKALSLPNVGMAVTIDIGEWNDIHPWNKHEPGRRLALLAEKMVYGENIVAYGPMFESASIDGDKITISFTHTGTGLVNNDGEPLSDFAIAGADKKFVWAKAEIVGDKVVVHSDEITNPQYVRYAWADSPIDPNLFNQEGLPASPFRTDE